jgi:MFS family permease
LFASLYLSEGAPIGFIWLALPTRLRMRDVPIDQITWLAAILVLPWTLKFAWAPLIDLFRSRLWTLRHWVVSAQIVMGLTLVPLFWLDPQTQFSWLAITLLFHAFAAATQDVSIDALCISSTDPGERGEYNGWMQTGMMLGRAMMGGGALVLSGYLGDQVVVGLLILLTTFSMVLVILSRPPVETFGSQGSRSRLLEVRESVSDALSDRNTWIGLGFAIIGGAAFKSLEVIYGPFLIDRGIEQQLIGWFSMGPMIGAMIVGAIAGGYLTDRFGPKRCVLVSLVYISVSIAVMAIGDSGRPSPSSMAEAAVTDASHEGAGGSFGTAGRVDQTEFDLGNAISESEPSIVPIPVFLLGCLTMTSFGIGAFTSASYALFMDISRPAIAATQFSAFMGATNGCESWSSFASGKLIAAYGYPWAMLTMCAISLMAIPLLVCLKHKPSPNSRLL